MAQIPNIFEDWFDRQGWRIRDYQRDMVAAYQARRDTLLIAPTGGGKTLAGFLPVLSDLYQGGSGKLHTLYISPLRALTQDIERNLERPVADLSLPITIGSRTGDTSGYMRQKWRQSPPDILLTTPESLMILLSYPDAAAYFGDLKCTIVDEVHSFATGKRGDFTALALTRLKSLSPDHVRLGLSATIADTDAAATWLGGVGSPADVMQVAADQKPDLNILPARRKIPLGGHSADYAVRDIYDQIKAHRSTIVFVNTRAQAELMFQQLWRVNDEALPIGIYHGSLSPQQRQKTENLVAEGKLRALVSTSALEMGIDWGDVDLVIQTGAPKGVSRLMQRIGRSNHRMDEPSLARLVPTNCLEVIECAVAMEAIARGERDGEPFEPGALDVAAQYIVNRGCEGDFEPDALFAEIRRAAPYAHLTRETFDRLLAFARDGGSTLESYDRFQRLFLKSDGTYVIKTQEQARRHRMNVGTIVEYAKLKVKKLYRPGAKRGRWIGEIEEGFVITLRKGDTFIFNGEVLRFERIRDMAVEVSAVPSQNRSLVPRYAGGMMPLSSYLSDGVRAVLSDPARWRGLPDQVQDWLTTQSEMSHLPGPGRVLVEVIPARPGWHMVVHGFAGRKVHNALGFLLSRRLESAGAKPMSFNITDYALVIATLDKPEDIRSLLSQDIAAAELEDWIMDSPMLKRAFRKIATIAGLVDQRLPGQRKSAKQMTFSTDLIYDVLKKYEPENILMTAAREDAERDLIDVARLKDWLSAEAGELDIVELETPSPLAIPAILQIGKENIVGEAVDALMENARLYELGQTMLENARAAKDAA